MDVASEAPAPIPVRDGVPGEAIALPSRHARRRPGTHAGWLLAAAAADAVLQLSPEGDVVAPTPREPATRCRFSGGGEALLEAGGGALSPVADAMFATQAAPVDG